MFGSEHSLKRKYIDWVALALSTGHYRKELHNMAVIYHVGYGWLCATDTLRVHMVRLSEAEEFKSYAIDARRLLIEMDYSKVGHILIQKDGSIELFANGDKLGACSCLAGEFNVHISKVIPTEYVQMRKVTNIDPKYLSDALSMQSQGCHFYQDGRHRQLVIESVSSCDEKMIAIIMPMSSTWPNILGLTEGEVE